MRPDIRIALLALALALGASPAYAQSHEHHHGAPTDKAAPASKAAPGSKGFGRPGDPAKVSRTIAIGMDDTMRFSPSVLAVRQGETVRFVATNGGKQMHEMVIGTSEALRKHAEQMRKSPAMKHDDAGAVHVAPGAAGEIVWTFDRAGKFAFACLVPGHLEAGMAGTIEVR